MSKKSKLKKEIDDIEREIEALEQKRERSQIAVMRAMMQGVKPSPEDQHYFLTFSMLIDNERENLRQLYVELAELGVKKKKGLDIGEEEPKKKKKWGKKYNEK